MDQQFYICQVNGSPRQQFAIFKFSGIRVKRNASWGSRQLLVKYVKHSFIYYEIYRKFSPSIVLGLIALNPNNTSVDQCLSEGHIVHVHGVTLIENREVWAKIGKIRH